ncbi:hypothetical protein [Solimonas marina]|uniref:Uncharacterized protein n=1 Tax=Solimonas marina TaxID=2714601 RepID=A0A969W885_9GAMM|nr:hypothetical protein [Solimonas marina]NKF20761.1 hypothetical protein [Solimonas marina]
MEPERPEKPAALHSGGDALFRVLGVALQIAATLAVARTLTLFETGLFFEGFVVTIAGAAFVRAKLDLYLGRHIVAELESSTGIGNAELLRALSRRAVKRSALICAVLLVIMADADVMVQSLHPYFQTFTPFVLALPLVSYASMIASALRAAGCHLKSLICTAYAMNATLLIAVAVAPPAPPVAVFSWIFLIGSAVAAATAYGFAHRVFGPAPRSTGMQAGQRHAWTSIDAEINKVGGIGFANAALLWAPMCLLVLLAPPTEMARYAVSTRTAQLLLYLMPLVALLLAPQLRAQHALAAFGRSAMWRALRGITLASAVMAAALIASAHWSLTQYGAPYETAVVLFAVLVLAEMLATMTRPLFRYHAAHWNQGQAGHVLYSAAAVATGLTLLLMPWLQALGAAIALAAGHATAVILGARAALRSEPRERGIAAH